MAQDKVYWKSFGDLAQTEDFKKSQKNEFAEDLPLEALLGSENGMSSAKSSRRDFLKFLGFSVGAATLAACETPVVRSIPYLNKPENLIPGIANYYATTYYDGNDFAGVLVKTREGRPINIQGNKLSPFTKGGLNSRINSSVLSLYDSTRLKSPLANGAESDWTKVDAEIKKGLESVSASGKKIALLTNSIISPSTKRIISEFALKYPTLTHITYDAISYSGIRNANELSFGKPIVPSYDFSKAKTIVSIDADFLASWLLPTQFIADYAKTRRVENGFMSKHFQFESNMSLSGANADERIAIKPSEIGKIAVEIYNEIASLSGSTPVTPASTAYSAQIKLAAKKLWDKKGESLVVCGANDTEIQVVINAINNALGNYGSTINLNSELNIKQAKDQNLATLMDEMKSGSIGAILISGVNPVYSMPNGVAFADFISKVSLSVSFADRNDETASKCKFVCPDNHYLESWNDAELASGNYFLSQPTIGKLFNTRQLQESLLIWSDATTKDYYSYLKNNWNETIYTKQTAETYFESFWNKALHNGSFVAENIESTLYTFNADLNAAASKAASVKAGKMELSLYQKAGLGDGSQANNPWLQELPDPITKITWDNYVTMSPKQMEEMGFSLLERGDHEAHVVEVKSNGYTIKLPVVPQPGQAYGTIGIALGYGRTAAGKVGNGVGQNAFPFITSNGNLNYYNYNVEVSPVAGEVYQIAATQTHHTLMDRHSIVKETTLKEYTENPASGNHKHELATHKGKQPIKEIDIWAAHPVENVGHRWGLAIDLSTCLGCGSCVTACQSENNVPVVGKDEVRRSREMHWIRIDRYYTSDYTKANFDELGTIGGYSAMERASENPKVSFQPLMCQHCNHAPCETVCPVAATTHSNEGLNQMTYNRCIGTRYCANNCPYKVRRFNWFNYIGNPDFTNVNPSQDDIGRMVLNPDVTVRSRGVMEKCSLCVQSIQAGKLKAKSEGRKVKDGDANTACASACPTNAIVFGDINDKDSKINSLSKDPRSYYLLEEVGVQPNIYYMTKIRNTESAHA